MNEKKYLVSIRCMTYNQSAYIVDAMNGFCMQQTSFPFLSIIMDDASTDGEQLVIEDYIKDNFLVSDSSCKTWDTEEAKWLFAQHRQNSNCFFLVSLLKRNMYKIKLAKLDLIKEWEATCKYIAICEGDDYWTDPQKLQKQVAFLEEHAEYVMCSHDFIRYYQNSMIYDEHSFYNGVFLGEETYFDYSLDNYFKGWWTQPLTCLYRNGEFLRTIPYKKYRHYRDDIFFYYILKEGKGALFSDVMGVYRVHDSGVWQGMQFKTQHQASRDNALAIYVNENDKRALFKASQEEQIIVINLCEGRHLWEALKEIVSYKKKVPKSEYHRFRRTFFEWFRWKVSRRAKAFFAGKARLFFC